MEIRQLRYFISAATHLNFTKAAKECFIVQTAMTAQMTKLEGELGVQLFERQSRGLALTEAGEKFLLEAKKVVRDADAAQEKMEDYREGYTARLRVSHQGELFRGDLVDILRRFNRERPDVRVMLYQLPWREAIPGLREGQLDVAFMPCWDDAREERKWLVCEELAESSFMMVTAKDYPLADREKITMAEFCTLPRIGFQGSPMDDGGPEAPANIYGQIKDHTSAQILIESGCCVGAWPERMCRPEQYPNLRFAKIADFPRIVRPALFRRAEPLSEEGKAFRREVLRQYGKL